MAKKTKIVALTGAFGFLGRRLQAFLDDDTVIHTGQSPESLLGHASKLVVISSTRVYGASASNPSFIKETAGLAFIDPSERLAARCKCPVVVLRPCTVVGPTADTSNFLSRRIVPTVLGFDPLMQFLHEDDFLAGVKLALAKKVSGAFNLAGDGVLPLSSVLKLTRAIRLPLLYPAPAQFRFSCVADNAHAKDLLDFAPAFSSKAALLDYVQTLNLRRIAA